MTVIRLLRLARELSPSTFSDDTLLMWISQVENILASDVAQVPPEELTEITESTNAQMLIQHPFDRVYLPYVQAQIAYAQGETDLYQNYLALYNAYRDEWIAWVRNGKWRHSEWYVSAYNIAVEHGYSGTIDEWLNSLTGEKGEKGDSVVLLGSYATLDELMTAHPVGHAGDYYAVGVTPDTMLAYYWDPEASGWRAIDLVDGQRKAREMAETAERSAMTAAEHRSAALNAALNAELDAARAERAKEAAQAAAQTANEYESKAAEAKAAAETAMEEAKTAAEDAADSAEKAQRVEKTLVRTDTLTETIHYGRGQISGTKITYFGTGSSVLLWFTAIPNTRYKISKTYGNRFQIGCTASAPKANEPITGYQSVVGTEAWIMTGEDTTNVVIYAASDVAIYPYAEILAGTNITLEVNRVTELQGRVEKLEEVVSVEEYACALPRDAIRLMVGNPQKWYAASMVTPSGYLVNVKGNAGDLRHKDGLELPNSNPIIQGYGYFARVYDRNLRLIEDINAGGEKTLPITLRPEGLTSCTMLAIGDSTIAQNGMTRYAAERFEEAGKTLTLLGTQGTPENRHEGRSGWSAEEYCTMESKAGLTNPFYKAGVGFDFDGYMTNHGIDSVDFVVIQLGINDLYNAGSKAIEQTWGYIRKMIDSIHDSHQETRIILNLPTTPNAEWAEHSVFEPLYRNRVIRYNEYAMKQVYGIKEGYVRCSNCHLILDPETDIRDNVHPTDAGYRKMGYEVVSQINCWQNEV